MRRFKAEKGITLVALIITIIVMLILVAVTISIALSGGLFDKARTSVNQTQEKVIYEEIIASLDIDNSGLIRVKPTYDTVKELLESEGKSVELVNPSDESTIDDTVTIKVLDKYTFEITSSQIVIQNE